MKISDTFAKRLLEVRGNMSQAEFAQRLGVSRGSIGLYEQGKRLPDIEVLRNIAEQFNVSCDWLVGLTDTKVIEPDIKAVCKVTGLTEENVNLMLVLQKYDKTIKEHSSQMNQDKFTYIDVFNIILKSLDDANFIKNAHECLNKFSDDYKQDLNDYIEDSLDFESELIEKYPDTIDYIINAGGAILTKTEYDDFLTQQFEDRGSRLAMYILFNHSNSPIHKINAKRMSFKERETSRICIKEIAFIQSQNDNVEPRQRGEQNANDNEEE